MSRSNPTERTSNPAAKFFEWNGEHGTLSYYDRAQKKNIPVALPFVWLLLDELATVKGWSDASDSGIYANEVKDTKADVMVVKSFKGGVIAQGFYANIRDRVNAAGGNFTASLYCAYKDAGGPLTLGNISFRGAALNAWIEFRKAHSSEVLKKAIRIAGFGEGKKGKVTFRFPKFVIQDTTPETDAAATELDKGLQEYLTKYLGKTKAEQVTMQTAAHSDEPPLEEPPIDYENKQTTELDDLSVPF